MTKKEKAAVNEAYDETIEFMKPFTSLAQKYFKETFNNYYNQITTKDSFEEKRFLI